MDESFIRVHIETHEPIELSQFVQGLAALESNFSDYAKKRNDTQTTLLVKEVKEGSIIVDLICCIASSPTLPFFDLVADYIPYVKDMIGYIRSKCLDKITKKEVADLASIGTLAKSAEDKISIQSVNGNIFNGSVTINQNFGVEALDMLKKYAPSNTNNEQIYTNQMLYFVSLTTKPRGHRGKIDNLSKRALNVVFDTEEIQNQFIHGEENPFEKTHLVDVVLITKEDKPFAYKVMKYHGAYDNLD